MDAIAYYLASGESLYIGAAVLLLVLALAPWIRHRWLLRLKALVMWGGLALMVMACPPFPIWVDALFFAAFIAWLLAWGKISAPAGATRRRWRYATAGALAALLVLLPAAEWTRRRMPVAPGVQADHLTVIGDSISSGILREDPWPVVLEKTRGIRVKNLAQAGAGVADAGAMADKLTPDDRLILIEIGGNDLIAGMPTAEFSAHLEALLARCCTPGRTVVMFELPLLPHRIGYGRAQRALADHYQVTLIPKRAFIAVINGSSATSDGLHLAPEGARRMADLVWDVLGASLNKRP